MTYDQMIELGKLVHAKDQEGVERFMLQFDDAEVGDMLTAFGVLIFLIEHETDEDARNFWMQNDSVTRVGIHKTVEVDDDADPDEVVAGIMDTVQKMVLPRLIAESRGYGDSVQAVYVGPDVQEDAVTVRCVRCDRTAQAPRSSVPEGKLYDGSTALGLCADCVVLSEAENRANE